MRSLKTLLPLVMLSGAACSGGERTATGPEAPTGGPVRATLIVTVGIAAEDANLAARLGWTGGVPGAEVRLLANGTNSWDSAVTDENGVVTFGNRVPGLYRLFAGRTLTTGEAQSVGEPARAFGDGQTIDVVSGEFPITLHLLADREGGLVLSEIGQWVPPVQETGLNQYNEALYFEVYNNSAQTLFLDGKTFGTTFRAGAVVGLPCSAIDAVRASPAGVLTSEVIAFPGSGNEYPILPGEAKIIPIAAIDHTVVHPDLWDFTGAAFEIRGAASADNPSVPDMRDVGLRPFIVPIGGTSVTKMFGIQQSFFLADAFDPHDEPIVFRDVNGQGWVHAPADKILDVITISRIRPDNDREFPVCVPMINSRFDRYEGFRELGTIEPLPVNVQRRALRLEGGRSVLQNSNTTAVDFFIGAATPGTLPPS